MKKIIGSILLVIVTSFMTAAQEKTNQSFKQLVSSIAANNKYESQFVGFAGSPSEQYQNYQRLKSIATKDELVSLLKHKNAVVRIYSFKSLYEKDPKLAERLSGRLLADTAEFMTLQGCIAGVESVKTFVQQLLRNND